MWRSRFAGLTVRNGSNYDSAGPCSSVGVRRLSRGECGFSLSHTEQCCTEVDKLLACCTVFSFLPQHSFSTAHLNCRANQPFNIYHVAIEANLGPRCPPSMLQDKKKTSRKRNTTGEAHCKKTSNYVLLYPPPSLRRDNTISCLPGAPASMLQEKNTNRDKHDRKRTARKTNNGVPPALTTSQQTLSRLTGAPAWRHALRSSPSSRSVLLMAQFTVRPRHGAPLRRALRVCSSTCTLVSVLRLSAVRCPLPVCVQPALLRGTAVPNLHYRGTALDSAGPALWRALSVSRDFSCTIPGTCTIRPALYRAQYCIINSTCTFVGAGIRLFGRPYAGWGRGHR